jgi:hypothetical protein
VSTKKPFLKKGIRREKGLQREACSGKVDFGVESSLYTWDEGPKKPEDHNIVEPWVRRP